MEGINKRIPKNAASELGDLKKYVEQYNTYFSRNLTRYNEFMRFVFQSSLQVEDLQTLRGLGKPTIEFNVLESFISRLRGEFAKQQPSLTVSAADGVPISSITPQFKETMKVVEAYIRSIFFDASNDSTQYDVFSDLLGGGFSALEIYTDYVNERAFEQNIYVSRVFDPTLCGFDPLARQSHKGDGRYCFQLYPKTKSEFEAEFGDKPMIGMKYSRDIGGFGWSYRDEVEEIILVCDFYKKVKKKEKIFKLTNGKTYTQKELDDFYEDWEAKGKFEQPPAVVNQRWTVTEKIVRYRFCETQMLDYVETNYKYLPIIFVDGNSVMITEGNQQYQFTRPYVYHAQGIQKLKNYAGQTLANELENMVQHKFVVALESIPEDYLEAYENVQKPNTLIYKHFIDQKMPDVTLPPPREIVRTPIPPEVTNTFRMSDEMTQTILGSFDSVLGVNSKDVSGTAIALGAMQSNNTSMPYIMGYIKALNRVGQIIIDLIPKYYRTPRTLPVLLPNGKRESWVINDKERPGSIFMNYDGNELQVKVETGTNFAMQKHQALQTLTMLMQVSPQFNAFMNEKGLPVLLDNIEIRGIDGLRADADQWMRENNQKAAQLQQQQQQMMMQQQQITNQKLQAQTMYESAIAQRAMREAKSPTKGELDMMKMSQDFAQKEVESQQQQQKIDIDYAKLLAELEAVGYERFAEEAKISSENARTAMEALRYLAQANSNQIGTGEMKELHHLEEIEEKEHDMEL